MRRRARGVVLAVGLLVGLAAPAGWAQGPDELRLLRQELEAIRRELEEIKGLLRGRAAGGPAPEPREVVIRVEGAPAKGDPAARVTLVEFSDYQCPFCARHVRDTLPQLQRDYIDTGKLRYVMRDFPLESIHPQAFKGHVAARCAGDQGRYWEMHDRLFARQAELQPADLVAHARGLGLEEEGFRACLESERHDAAVRADFQDGVSVGVNGTPMFFLGLTRSGEPGIKAVRVIRGAQPYAAFRQAIDALLAAP
jgi:protein-disulfide isomerase